MDSNNIAISQFADTCKIPRPTMSQILNGRNKKISDELITKIHTAYPSLSVLWLMFGEGEMDIFEDTQTSEGQKTSDERVSNQQTADNQEKKLFGEAGFPISDEMAEKSRQTVDAQTPQSGTSVIAGNARSASIPSSTNIPRYNNEGSVNTKSNVPKTSEVIDFEMMTGEFHSPKTNAQDSDSSRLHTDNNDISAVNPEASTSATSQKYSPATQTDEQNAASHNPIRNISLQTSPDKRITNIVVFYSDNSFQSFSPSPI